MASNQTGFLFATGIESSIPTIQGGRVRMDEMDKCGLQVPLALDDDYPGCVTPPSRPASGAGTAVATGAPYNTE